MAKQHTKDAQSTVAPTPMRWYRPLQVAELLGVSETMLRAWRCERRGPRFVKFGDHKQARVVYPESAVIEWQNQQRTIETEQPNETEKAS